MQKIVIFPCNGDSAVGRITWLATQELVLAGQAKWCLSWQHIEEILDRQRTIPSPFIIVDGCEKQCLFNQLLEEGLVGKHHLDLSDVGINIAYVEDIKRDDIDLAKDAIIAECRPVKRDMHPPLAGCCCR